MTTWDGAGTTPPLMSVARALVERGHDVRVLADPVLREEVEASGAEHVAWRRAPHRKTGERETHFVRDWEAGPAGFARMRDQIAVGPAAAFAADVREELEARPADCLLTELLLFGPQVAAEAAGVPYVVLNPTINIVPAPGVPPFGQGLMPAINEADRERDRIAAELGMQAWDEALPALNAARAEHSLDPLEHVVDQWRAAALTLVMTSAAFDFTGELPPNVKYVGPRLDDPSWADEWSPPPGDQPLVLAALSSDFQAQEDVLRRIVAALASMPVRGVVTTGKGIDPQELPKAANVQVLRSASHAAVLREAAAVITHCGHGTTIKALAAGLPIVCMPMGRDQFDVAARVVHRGAGAQVEMSAPPEAIAKAVREVLETPAYREAARRVAAAMAEETARDRVVEELEALVRTESPPVTI
ncbi:MAG: glycosyltransferase [Chloroflexota bacterium]|nr:glycosyltransferase [Chloroflexota bacterium]